MSDAPERIWLDWPAANRGDPVYDEPPERDTQPGQTEYTRADLTEAAETRAWNAAIEAAWLVAHRHRGAMDMSKMIAALKKGEPK